jgi:AcrR family transcriptional regulator
MLEGEALHTMSSSVVEQIIDAATAAVAANGLDGLNMEDIAVRAGCARATVYRRVGGKDAIRDAVVREAVARITTAITKSVENLTGEHRIVSVIVASLDTIRADPVCSALLTGPATAETANSSLVSEYTATITDLSGLDPSDTVGGELIARATLALLTWPAADRDTELAIIRRHVSPLDPRNADC